MNWAACTTDCFRVKTLQLKKNDYFSEDRKIPRQIGFVIESVIRGYYYNGDGEKITRCLISEGNLVADYVNFKANITATEFLQACPDCRLIVFQDGIGTSYPKSLLAGMTSKTKWFRFACIRSLAKSLTFHKTQLSVTWNFWKTTLHSPTAYHLLTLHPIWALPNSR